MKKIFNHPPEAPNAKKYWRSQNQLQDTPEFRNWLEREFPAGASEMEVDGVSRRHFLKLMGASTALAGFGLTACRRPEKHLVPFSRGAEWAIPGKPLFYASSMPARGGAVPLIVTTQDGRPTKIEGNPLHPASNGGTDVFAQASILDLYDPDRSRFFLHKGSKSSAEKFEVYLQEVAKRAAFNQGEGIAFLAEKSHSPTRERLRNEIARKYPRSGWFIYEPLDNEAPRKATSVAYGDNIRTLAQIEKADVLLALDSDFLGNEQGALAAVRAFSSRRRVATSKDGMNRLYVVENHYTVTGGMADHRLRLPASHVGAFTFALAQELLSKTSDAGLAAVVAAYPKPSVVLDSEATAWVAPLAEDLLNARGKSLVLAGFGQPVELQLLAASINSALGNLGATVVGAPALSAPASGIAELAKQIAAKQISTLVIFGGNPVYNAPADLDWSTLQASVPEVVRLGLFEDETSQGVTWHVPAAHYLETWGDDRSYDGSYTSVQPMIMPLYNGYSECDVLALLLGQPKPQGPELVQATFRQVVAPSDFETSWQAFLHDGFLKNSSAAPTSITFNPTAAAQYISENAKTLSAASDSAYEVVFVPGYSTDDGRYANNAWLQEAADPVTKLTWDNAAIISAATAEKLGVKNGEASGDVIEISLNGRSVEVPILIAPGHADHSITLTLGYGRRFEGRVCKGAGVDVYPLRTTSAPSFATGAQVKFIGKTYALACTQDHHSMEGRAIVREATLETYQKKPDFAKKMYMDAEIPDAGFRSLYENPKLTAPNQWGMAIDLNTCIGCNACMVACQAENNIPVVGKEQVINGREMHWIRMDRYFASTDTSDPNPQMLTQPMMCQHCESAPCETVCPVNATVHSEDGLNVMAYNRCIGTRYCANNCPFKVRRFNFFNYNERPIQGNGLYLGPLAPKGTPDTIKMQKNPNVTVRIRGVMEKCTFCLQRIQEAKISQKVKAADSDNVRVPTDSFKTACQQACPAEAIIFGDVSDPESKVSKLKANDKNYRVLEYLNVNARVSYLARLRNPNMKMPGAEKIAAHQKHQIHGLEPHGGAH